MRDQPADATAHLQIGWLNRTSIIFNLAWVAALRGRFANRAGVCAIG